MQKKTEAKALNFSLNADGSFNLKSKTQNSVYVYNPTLNKYEIKANQKASTPTKKKK